MGETALDTRLTFYTRFGDLFAWMCVAGSAAITIGLIRGKGSDREIAKCAKEVAKNAVSAKNAN